MTSDQQSNPYASPPSHPGQPGPGYHHGQQPQKGKPVSITVFGILHLIFGLIGLCFLGAGIFGLIIVANEPAFRGENLILDHPMGYAYTIFSFGLGFISTFILIAAGVLLLMDRDMGRILTMIYGWISIIFGIIGIAVQAYITIETIVDPNLVDNEQFDAIFGLVTGTCGGFVGIIYAALGMYFLSREHVKAYLQGADPGKVGNFGR